ncbi:MAG: type II toxin-antitoxin system prevent-host-death family antitoxin, partial [Bacillota bacterium]
MIVSSTEVQNNFGKYLSLVEQEDIIITKNGKKVARLVNFQENDDYVIEEKKLDYSYDGKRVSYEEFLKIAKNSDNRYEYINGRIYLLSSPKVHHQKIIMVLSSLFFSYFKNKKCFPLSSPLEVTLYKNDEPNVVQPDFLIICDQENIKEDDSYAGTPSLVVEVLSRSTMSKDLTEKLNLYMAGGVEEYWIVNP